MSFFLAIILNLFNSGKIPEVKIDDPGVVAALNAYVDSINTRNEKPIIDYHLVARTETVGPTRIIYVCQVVSLSRFKLFGIPDNYSKLGNRIVFWFEQKNKVDADDSFKEFQNQFGNDLLNDLKLDGSIDFPNDEFLHKNVNFFSFRGGTYRFVIKRNKIGDVRRVCSFPDTRFYKLGYVYDRNGDLMYQDGVYDLCAIDRPFVFYKYDPGEYFESKGMVIDVKLDISAWITFDEDGKAIRADFVDKQNALTQQMKDRYKSIILTMPPWSGATVKGKKVKYRLNQAL
jgi:hypothetical protein